MSNKNYPKGRMTVALIDGERRDVQIIDHLEEQNKVKVELDQPIIINKVYIHEIVLSENYVEEIIS